MQELIEQIRSRNNTIALDAVQTLRAFDRLSMLQGETLIRANLEGADLAYADLRETVLIWAKLCRATLKMAKMSGAVLFRADLAGADLAGADLQRAYLMKANLVGARLMNSVFDAGTTLPDGSAWTPDTELARFTDPNHPLFWRDDDPTSPAYPHTTSYPSSRLIQ